MPSNKSRPFKDLLLERLGDPEVAKHYVKEALDESQESFLKALRVVAQAKQMTKVAKEANMQRESLYRALSEQGNPNLDNLIGVLAAVGMKLSIVRIDTNDPAKYIRDMATVGKEANANVTRFRPQEAMQGDESDNYGDMNPMAMVAGNSASSGDRSWLQQ
jgi:probable addiction module antidote protein